MAKPMKFDIPDDTPIEIVDLAGQAIQVCVITLNKAQRDEFGRANNG